MRVMVFTEGTLIMPSIGEGVSRGERVRQSIQGLPEVHDFKNYIPVGNAVSKLKTWIKNKAEVCYLTSRRTNKEIADIQGVLNKHGFPKGELYFRNSGEGYNDVAERVAPDVLIEDDCESIGGEVEMTHPHIRPELRRRIKSVVVKEFDGIDNLPDKLSDNKF